MRGRRTRVSIQGQPSQDAQWTTGHSRSRRDEVAVNAIGIGEDRRSPRKNLDEVSIRVTEARSTLFCDRYRGRESGLNAGALNLNLQGFLAQGFHLGWLTRRIWLKRQFLFRPRRSHRLRRLAATWGLDEVAIWVDKKSENASRALAFEYADQALIFRSAGRNQPGPFSSSSCPPARPS